MTRTAYALPVLMGRNPCVWGPFLPFFTSTVLASSTDFQSLFVSWLADLWLFFIFRLRFVDAFSIDRPFPRTIG